VRYYSEAKLSGSNGKIASQNPSGTETFDHVLNLAEQGDPHAAQALDRMAHYLGRGITMLVAGLAPDVIVVVGAVARAWDRVGPIVTDVVKQRSATHAITRIMASGSVPQPRLRGIVALVLQRHFGAPTTA
jgi:predicted NBD/HSP70 family sugar kinase